MALTLPRMTLQTISWVSVEEKALAVVEPGKLISQLDDELVDGASEWVSGISRSDLGGQTTSTTYG